MGLFTFRETRKIRKNKEREKLEQTKRELRNSGGMTPAQRIVYAERKKLRWIKVLYFIIN